MLAEATTHTRYCEHWVRHARTTDIDGYSKDPVLRLEQLTEKIFTEQTEPAAITGSGTRGQEGSPAPLQPDG